MAKRKEPNYAKYIFWVLIIVIAVGILIFMFSSVSYYKTENCDKTILAFKSDYEFTYTECVDICQTECIVNDFPVVENLEPEFKETYTSCECYCKGCK